MYVAHLRSMLLLVLCTIPIVYGCDWRWATIPLTLLIAFALLGLEAASVECERPFSPAPTKNHHDLERFAELISREVLDMLDRARLRAGGSARRGPLAMHKIKKSRTLYGLSAKALVDDVSTSAAQQ